MSHRLKINELAVNKINTRCCFWPNVVNGLHGRPVASWMFCCWSKSWWFWSSFTRTSRHVCDFEPSSWLWLKCVCFKCFGWGENQFCSDEEIWKYEVALNAGILTRFQVCCFPLLRTLCRAGTSQSGNLPKLFQRFQMDLHSLHCPSFLLR